MSFLSGGKTAKVPDYTGVPIQTSVWTLPVPVSWGTSRASGNLIWYSDFTKKPASNQGGKGGGKGGQYDYSAAIMLALGEGGATFVKCSTDGISWESLSQTGFGLIGGNVPQTAWSFLTSRYPSEALTYPGIAMLVNEQYQMGSSPQLPSLQVVLQWPLAGSASWASSGEFQNADLALIIQDMLTNARYGVPDYPSSAVGTATLLSTSAATTTGDNSLQTYCRANGWGFSPRIDSAETAATVLQRWLTACNCEAVWSGTTLKWVPYGDTGIAGNGVIYAPDLTPIYSLDDDDFIGDSKSDPVQISRVDPSDVPNIIRVEVTNNDGYYASYLSEARDQAQIEAVGERVGPSITAKEILSPAQGSFLAYLILQRTQGIRNTYTWKCDWTKCLLEPMDLVELTDANLGLVNYAVRITEVSEDDKGILTFVAEDFPQGLAGPVEYASQVTTVYVNNTADTAEPINTPVIFEPSGALTGGPAEVWLALSGGSGGVADPFWGGADIYVSSDNVNFQQIGSVDSPARQGTLVNTLPTYTGANPDITNTLTVNLSESGGELISTTALNASTGQTICFVDGELIAYTTATLISGNTYALTGLYRGLGGGAAVSAHAAGSLFARLDESVFIYVLPQYWVGVPLYFKGQSFNIWGQGYQSLAACTSYGYTPTGIAYTIANPGMPSISKELTLQPDGSTIITLDVVWSASTGPNVGSYNLIWSSDNGATFTGGTALGANVTRYQLKAAIPNALYIFKVQAISINGLAYSAYQSSIAYNSGAQITFVPSAPTGLTATPNTSGSIALKWNANASTDAVLNYEVFRNTGPSGTFSGATKIFTGLATAYVDTGLTNGAVYTYFMVAVNSLGASGNSAGVDQTATDNTRAPSTAYNVTGFWPGNLPTTAGTTIYTQTMTQTVVFSASLSGSYFYFYPPGGGGTIGCKISVNKNGSTIGLVWQELSGSVIHSLTADTTFSPGDVFSLTMQTNDNGGNNFAYTFVGSA